MTLIDFKAQAEAMRDDLIQRRRDLHQHPELAYQEVRTAGMKKAMEDPRMNMDPNAMPFDGKRMIYGSFEVLVQG